MRFLTVLALLGFTLLGEAQAAPPTCWPSNIGGTGGEATFDVANEVGPFAGWHCADGSNPLGAVRWGDLKGAVKDAAATLARSMVFGSNADRQAAATALASLVTLSPADVFDVWQSVATWVPLVKEGGNIINIPPTGSVIRYGAGTQWIIKIVWSDPANPATRSLPCTTEAFTSDPAPHVVKGCELAKFVGKAIPVAAPVYTHHVKPNGTAADRPVYPLVNGVRGTTAIPNVRATVLTDGKPTPCDPSKAQAPSGTSTTDLYAAYAPSFAASAVTLCTKQ